MDMPETLCQIIKNHVDNLRNIAIIVDVRAHSQCSRGSRDNGSEVIRLWGQTGRDSDICERETKLKICCQTGRIRLGAIS